MEMSGARGSALKKVGTRACAPEKKHNREAGRVGWCLNEGVNGTEPGQAITVRGGMCDVCDGGIELVRAGRGNLDLARAILADNSEEFAKGCG